VERGDQKRWHPLLLETIHMNHITTLIAHPVNAETLEWACPRAMQAGFAHSTLKVWGAPHGLFASRKDHLIADLPAFVRG